MIRDAEERSGGLRGAFGRTEGYKTGPRAMRARARIRDLDEALKRLRYLVGHRGTLTQQREKVNEAISQGDSLEDIFARRLDLIDPLLDRWDGLKRDLNQLADIYGVPGIGL